MKRISAALILAGALVLGGCTTDAEPASTSESDPVLVFAAASLQGSFDELAEAFVQEHPEYSVAPIVYDGSQALATQIIDGADVDVVAFANESSLVPVTESGRTDTGEIFATNTLSIAVAPGNPTGIADLADLANPDLSVVLCAAEVPCGTASQALLDAQDVVVQPVSEETNVSSVVTRVSQGEADAGLVYATDIAAADEDLDGIVPTGAEDVINRYPIAVAEDAPSADAAQAFVEFVLSSEGQRILTEYGFGAP